MRFSSDTIKTSKFAFSLTSAADKEVELADTIVGRICNAKADSVCLSLDISNIGKKLLADFYIDEETKNIGKAEMRIGQWVTLVYTDTYVDTAKVRHAVRREEREYVPLDIIKASVSSSIAHQELGYLYRGWGQFAWNDTTETVIKTAKLKYDENKYSDIRYRQHKR